MNDTNREQAINAIKQEIDLIKIKFDKLGDQLCDFETTEDILKNVQKLKVLDQTLDKTIFGLMLL